MLKKILSIATLTASITCLTYANDSFERNYIKLATGYSVSKGEIGDSNNPDLSQLYAGAKGGNSTIFGIGMGTYLSDNFRLGADLEYRGGFKSKKTIDYLGDSSQAIRIYSAMANINFDMPINDEFGLYAGAGAGVGRLSFDVMHIDSYGLKYVEDKKYTPTKNNFVWQLGAGVNWKLSDEATLGFGYRYIDFGKFNRKSEDGTYKFRTVFAEIPFSDISGGGEGKLKAHEFLIDIHFDL